MRTRWVVAGILLALAVPAPASAHFPQSLDATAQPNGTVSETSSTLPGTAKQATVTVTPGAGQGDEFLNRVRTAFTVVPNRRLRQLFCVAIALAHAFIDFVQQDFQDGQAELRLLFLGACLELAAQQQDSRRARAAASTCPATPLAVPAKITRVSGGWKLTVKGKVSKPRRPRLKISCRMVGTAMKIVVRPGKRGQSLRAATGGKLAIGFYNSGSKPVKLHTKFAVK